MSSIPRDHSNQGRKIFDGTGLTTRCVKHREGNCNTCQRLSDLEEDIRATRYRLEELLDERDKLAPLFNEHHDPLIDRFPVEIISHIFLLSLPYQPTLHVFDKPFEGSHHIQAVTGLSHVSRVWRDIALNTPSLWTILWVSVAYHRNPQPSFEQAQCWLQRCQHLPVYVGFHINPKGGEVKSIRHTIGAIISEAQRWRVLRIQGAIGFISWLSSRLRRDQLSSVEHFSIRTEDSDTTVHPGLICAPSMLTLSSSICFSQLKMDWSRLTVLYIPGERGKWTIRDLRRLFQASPRLSVLVVTAKISEEPTDRFAPTVTASALQTLDVRFACAGFWKYFVFPALKTLRLSHGMASGLSLNTAKELIDRSACRIEDFTLANTAFGDDAAQILNAMPHLVRLSLTGVMSLGGVVGRLAEVTSTTPGCFADLQYLHLDIIDLRSDWTLFGNFIRFKMLKLLKHVKVTFVFPLTQEKCKEVREQPGFDKLLAASKGLDFSLTNRNGEDLSKISEELGARQLEC